MLVITNKNQCYFKGYEIPKVEADTHPLAFGYDSMMAELENRTIESADVMFNITVNYSLQLK